MGKITTVEHAELNAAKSRINHEHMTVSFDASSLGRMRSIGEIIILLLSLEDSSYLAGILADVAKQMKIPIEDIEEQYNNTTCVECGISMAMHKNNGGKCF